MSRDYKSKTPPAARPHRGGGLLIGIFIGLLLGLGIAVGVAWYMNRAPIPFLNKGKPPEKSVTPALPEPGTGAAGVPGTALPPPAGQAPDKPRFDFYKILPGTEEPVSEQQIRQAGKTPATLETGKVTFFLQAGSFQNDADAENLKARLALIGVEASVQSADVGEKGIWHRVRIGPYAKIEDTSKVRQMLAQNGIEATVIKVKDNPAR